MGRKGAQVLLRCSARRRCRRRRELKHGSSLPSAAVTGRPACAMRERRPTVFRTTVLPPAFGPLTMSARLILAQFDIVRDRVLAAARHFLFPDEQRMPRPAGAVRAFPERAPVPSRPTRCRSGRGHGPRRSRRGPRPYSRSAVDPREREAPSAPAGCAPLSSRSSMRSSASRLFCSSTSSGSTKSVAREPDCPCTTPLMLCRKLRFERQHVPVVADRDHRFLDDLLESAVLQDAGHAVENVVPRPHDLFADLPELRTGRVPDLARSSMAANTASSISLSGRMTAACEHRSRGTRIRHPSPCLRSAGRTVLTRLPAASVAAVLQQLDRRQHGAGNAEFFNRRPDIEDAVQRRVLAAVAGSA